MCGYTAIQAVLWIGERVCYRTVVVVIIIPKYTYGNIFVWKFPFDRLYMTETFTVQCNSICGNIHCTSQNHAPLNRRLVMCDI